MKVLMLNTFDDVAGADRAARRLQQGLRRAGVDASLLVQFRCGDGEHILCRDSSLRKVARRLKLYLGTLPVRLYPHRPENSFSPALLPDRLPAQVSRIAPDIVHLHWLGAGFCRIETIARFARPLIWTLHDSWPFTGGCHVPGDCRRYQERCGACPVLGSTREADLSRWTWNRKSRAWKGLRPTLVAPSRWLADCAASSSLFRGCRVEVIPIGLDAEAFRPMPQGSARERLGLPPDRPVVLYGAVNPLTDRNKGWHLLEPALKIVAQGVPEALAVVFGAAAPATAPDAGMPVVFLGHLRDEAALVAAYSAADVFVAPSRQETFCQTAAEAMACGTPVVAFGATGLLDVVEHQGCGYLAHPYDVGDLGRGIAWVLGDRTRHERLSLRAREKVEEEFRLDRVAGRYLAIYRDLLAQA
ncbi:MAG: glycosyltransferase [Proteobacteria bacterium]|nr:glycosyltransferase [Pseudomonadota bacterium]